MLLHVQLDGSERVLSLHDLEERIRDGTLGPETPVRGESLTQDRWVALGDLELYRSLRDSPQVLLREAWARPGVPWFTALLVGVELRVFLWTHWTALEENLVTRFSRATPAIVEGNELWRLVTYGFFHGSLGHVAMNLVFIAYLGLALEGVLGSLNLAVLFFCSVFWGGTISALLSPSTPSIGASAGDFGYLAGAAVFGLRYLDLLPAKARRRFGVVLLVLTLYLLLNGVLAATGIDNWGHFGGLLAGGLHVLALRPNVGAAWRARNLRTSFTAVLLVAAGTAAIARLPIPLVPVEEDGLVASRPPWWEVAWAPTGERAWSSPVDDARLVVRTAKRDAPGDAEAAAEALLADYRAVDTNLVVDEEVAVIRDGVPGLHLRFAYEDDGEIRRVDAEVFARGRYSHRVLLDVPLASTRVLGLWRRVLADVRLPMPEEVATAEAATGGWRGRLEQARGAADIGDPARARDLLDAARAEAPGEPAVWQALLELEADYPSDRIDALLLHALAASPQDRGVRVALARALVAAGREQEARNRLHEWLVESPGDKRLLRLQDELFSE